MYISLKGKESMTVTMRDKTTQILRSYFNEQEKESQKHAIIQTAARLIKSDIKSNVPSVAGQYLSTKFDSALWFVPETLRTLLNGLFVGKETSRKAAGIGQAIQLGLAVQAHHMYRSQIHFLVDPLHGMGFASSYKEVLRLEKNAADSVAPDMLPRMTQICWTWHFFLLETMLSNHNILTIDGKGTFHGMGIIAAITPGQKRTVSFQGDTLPT